MNVVVVRSNWSWSVAMGCILGYFTEQKVVILIMVLAVVVVVVVIVVVVVVILKVVVVEGVEGVEEIVDEKVEV